MPKQEARKFEDETLYAKIRDLEAQIAKINDGEGHICKVVFGGLGEIGGAEAAEKWLKDTMKEHGLPAAQDIYFKGDTFRGMLWAKFGSQGDRDRVALEMRNLKATAGGQVVWANPDQPVDVRAVDGFLFGLKKQLIEWGFVRKEIWVDVDTKSMSITGCGTVVKGRVCEGKLTMDWCDGTWAAWQELHDAAEMKELIKKAEEKLSKGGSKAGGKSKDGGGGGGKGKSGVSGR